ncbi:unnamed protein product [Trichobilharzia regenti]|nr:unnamed protein product [Trichobilharzia regenti]
MYRAIDGIRLLESPADRRFTPNSHPGCTVALYTKDFRIYELTVNSVFDARSLEQALDMMSSVDDASQLYPFFYKMDSSSHRYKVETTDWPNNIKEILCTGDWRISDLNKNYELCNSYFKMLLVPAKCDDQMLIESSRFRQGGRFPVLLYYHKPRQVCTS